MNKELLEVNAKNLIRHYNRVNGTTCKVCNENNLNLVMSVLQNGIESGNSRVFWNLKEYIENNKGVELRKVFNDFASSTPSTPVETKPEEKTTPVETKTSASNGLSVDELKAELSSLKEELKAAQSQSQMGLLEKTLAQVVVQTQGESIKNAILDDFAKKADEYIAENYGTIRRKVEVEVGENTVHFDEVLHEKFETVLKFVKMDEPVFLTGQAGTGKNVICKQVAKALNLEFYFSNAVTQEYKITGFTDAQGVYHETQFYQAFKNGGLFMLDEMDASIPEVLVILNAAIANRYFDFPHGKDKDGNEVGGYTEAHPDFRVIAAGNTFGLGADYEYVGRNQLDMASLDRFALVEIDYDYNIEKSVAEGDTDLVEFIEAVRRVAKANGIKMVISYRAIARIAKMKKLLTLPEVLQTCLFKNLRNDDINTIYDALPFNPYNEAVRELVK